MILIVHMQVKLLASSSTRTRAAGAGGEKRIRDNFSAPSMSSSTSSELEASSSKIVTEEEFTVPSPFEGDTVELTCIPLDRFVDQQFAQIFQCNICMDIPTQGNYIK